MNVRELMEVLKNLDPTLEVRMAIQPRYPLEMSIAKVTLLSEVEDGDGDGEEARMPAETDYVMLLEGSHIGYGVRSAW
jgi:hypothetical protein